MQSQNKKKLNILLEGMDQTGKSTLANMLASDLDLEIRHSSTPPIEGLFEFYHNKMVGDTNKSGVVMDRGSHSNYGFGGVYGGGVLTIEELRELDEVLINNHFILILMTDTTQAIYDRLLQEGKSSIGADPPVFEDVRDRQARWRNMFTLYLGKKRSCVFSDLVDVDVDNTIGIRKSTINGYYNLLKWIKEED